MNIKLFKIDSFNDTETLVSEDIALDDIVVATLTDIDRFEAPGLVGIFRTADDAEVREALELFCAIELESALDRAVELVNESGKPLDPKGLKLLFEALVERG